MPLASPPRGPALGTFAAAGLRHCPRCPPRDTRRDTPCGRAALALTGTRRWHGPKLSLLLLPHHFAHPSHASHTPVTDAMIAFSRHGPHLAAAGKRGRVLPGQERGQTRMGEVEIKVHLFAKAKELAGGRDFLLCAVQAADASISCQDFLDRYVYKVSRRQRQLARAWRAHPRAPSPPPAGRLEARPGGASSCPEPLAVCAHPRPNPAVCVALTPVPRRRAAATSVCCWTEAGGAKARGAEGQCIPGRKRSVRRARRHPEPQGA
jgi:hypothetical protein